MNGEIAIKAEGLNIFYGSSLILENLSFEINKGEFIGIFGKSGTGKTSLLNAVAGFIKTEGKLVVQGNVGFCFQNHSLFHWMTVEENIAFGLGELSVNDKRSIVKEMLLKIGLEKSSKKYPFQLSGGQMQRVALARALAYKPSIILLDEPFSALDLLTRDEMTEWVLEFIRQYDVTVLMVTHYLDEALLFSDRIYVLKEHKLAHILNIELKKPRTQDIKFSDEFKADKQLLLSTLN